MEKVIIDFKIIIASSDKYFFPQLSLGKSVGKYYVIQSELKKPMTILKDPSKEKGAFAYGKYQEVSCLVYEVIEAAIEARAGYSMLDNYTFLIAYCLANKICLFHLGIFEEKDKKFL